MLVTRRGIRWHGQKLEEMRAVSGIAFETRYFDTYLYHETRRMEWPWALEQVPLPVRAGEPFRVLDIGADAYFTVPLMMLRRDVTQVHLNLTHFDVANLSLDKRGLAENYRKLWARYKERIRMHVGLPRHLADVFRSHSFDVVSCVSVIEHVPREEIYRDWLDPMWALLKPGGRLIMTMDWSDTEDDKPGVLQNHDISAWLKALDGDVKGLEDAPWDESSNYHRDPDRLSVPWDDMRLGVFGFCADKRS